MTPEHIETIIAVHNFSDVPRKEYRDAIDALRVDLYRMRQPITAADEAGVPVESMSKQVGHRRIDTTRGYQRKGGASIRRGIASIFQTNGSNE